jgi:NADH-quinone oxidoreductase subunit L
MKTTFPLYWIPLLPLLGAAFNLIIGRRLDKRIGWTVACMTVGFSFCVAAYAVIFHLYPQWAAAHADPNVAFVPIHNEVYDWISSGALSLGQGSTRSLDIKLAFTLDTLSAVMVLTVTFVGFLIHLYSVGYMAHDPRVTTYFGYLNLFTGAMLILVLGDSLPVMFIGWEGVGTCSFLLIGFWYENDKYATAGKKAFIVNRIGDFFFLLGIFLLWSQAKRVDFAGLEQARGTLAALPPQMAFGQSWAFWGALCLFIGACGKSAQIPLYVWLPDAMAGPTPVSALIHAATMVTAGVYMVARLSFLYTMAPLAGMIVAGVGAATAIFAAIIGFAQTDIKKVLAYSTVSQLGFMFVGVGTGAYTAGVFHLFTHAFFKAGLFLGAGSVMHAMSNSTDIMKMGGLRKKVPITHATFLIYCLAIAGIFPFAGFFSKDEILLGAYTAHLDQWPAWYGKALWMVLSVAALGTAFYMWRLYFLVFWGESRADAETQAHIHESPWTMTLPLVVLAVGATGLGFLGLPHSWGAHPFLGSWLPFPEHEVHAGTGNLLMGVAFAAGVLGIGIAYLFYKDGPSGLGSRVAAALGDLVTFARDKFYIDELYDAIIVKPFHFASTFLFRFVDRILIDKVLVEGWAILVGGFARLGRVVQNGDVQRYLLVMLLGGVAIFWLASRQESGFAVTAEPAGSTVVRLKAELGQGLARTAAKAGWDFDNDGKVDETGADITHDFGAPGRYDVTLHVTDVFGETKNVKRTIEVGL